MGFGACFFFFFFAPGSGGASRCRAARSGAEGEEEEGGGALTEPGRRSAAGGLRADPGGKEPSRAVQYRAVLCCAEPSRAGCPQPSAGIPRPGSGRAAVRWRFKRREVRPPQGAATSGCALPLQKAGGKPLFSFITFFFSFFFFSPPLLFLPPRQLRAPPGSQGAPPAAAPRGRGSASPGSGAVRSGAARSPRPVPPHAAPCAGGSRRCEARGCPPGGFPRPLPPSACPPDGTGCLSPCRGMWFCLPPGARLPPAAAVKLSCCAFIQPQRLAGRCAE